MPFSPRRQNPSGPNPMIPPMTNISTQSTPCRGRNIDKEEWRAPVKMQNDLNGTSNFKRSATMTGIVKGQRRDVQKTKTHVRLIHYLL